LLGICDSKNWVISSTPVPLLRLVKNQGFPFLINSVSLFMIFKSAPPIFAKSILFINNKSDLVIPGPPFLGILSPADTSMTYIDKSTSSGLKLDAKLSPPLSTKTKSKGWYLFSKSKTAFLFNEQSSLIAVWGQPPVSTPIFLPSSKTYLFIRKFASSLV